MQTDKKSRKAKKRAAFGLGASFFALFFFSFSVFALGQEGVLFTPMGQSASVTGKKIGDVRILPGKEPSLYTAEVVLAAPEALNGRTAMWIAHGDSYFFPVEGSTYYGQPWRNSDGLIEGFRFSNLYFAGGKPEISFFFTDAFGRLFGVYEYQAKAGEVSFAANPSVFSKASAPPRETVSRVPGLQPHLLLESYDYGGKDIVAGKDFTLHFRLKNQSQSFLVENVVVKIAPMEGMELSGSSNTLYFSKLAPGEVAEGSANFRLSLETSQTVDVQPISMAVFFQYHEKEGEAPLTSADEVTLSVPVRRMDRLQVLSASFSEDLSEKNKGSIHYSFVNSGYAPLYQVEAQLTDADGSVLGRQYYGKLEQGVQKEGEQLSFSVPDHFTGGTLIFTYEDERLNKKSVFEKVLWEPPAKEVDSPETKEENPSLAFFQRFIEEEGKADAKEQGVNGWLVGVVLLLAGFAAFLWFLLFRRWKEGRSSFQCSEAFLEGPSQKSLPPGKVVLRLESGDKARQNDNQKPKDRGSAKKQRIEGEENEGKQI